MYSSSQGCHTATGTHMPHGITQCHTQMWHSRPYPSRSWYSIKRPRRDVRLKVCRKLQQMGDIVNVFLNAIRWISILVISSHNSFRVLFDKIASVLFEKYIYFWHWKETASPGNQHCANCFSTLSFPTGWQWRNFVPYLCHLIFAAIL